jgi:lipopolysaccharide export system protein LptA
MAAAGLLGLAVAIQSGAVASATAGGITADALAQGGGASPPAASAAAATGLVTIEADSQQADNATGIITAKGNVRITYPDRQMVATSRQAQYFSKEGRLVLTGDVDVVDERGQRLQAERVVYLLDSERLLAQPPAGRQVVSRFRLPAPASPAPQSAGPQTTTTPAVPSAPTGSPAGSRLP